MVTALHNRENCGTGFSRKLQLVLVVILLPAFSIFSLSPFHRFEDWTAQHQADKLLVPKALLDTLVTTDYLKHLYDTLRTT